MPGSSVERPVVIGGIQGGMQGIGWVLYNGGKNGGLIIIEGV